MLAWDGLCSDSNLDLTEYVSNSTRCRDTFKLDITIKLYYHHRRRRHCHRLVVVVVIIAIITIIFIINPWSHSHIRSNLAIHQRSFFLIAPKRLNYIWVNFISCYCVNFVSFEIWCHVFPRRYLFNSSSYFVISVVLWRSYQDWTHSSSNFYREFRSEIYFQN